LHVDGDFLVSDGSTEVLEVNGSAGNPLSIQSNSLSPAFDVTGIGSVGIGTTQPSAIFEVVSGGSEVFRISDAPSDNYLEIDTDKFVINSSGDAGIGTTNPTQKLDVNGNVRLRGEIRDVNDSPGTSNYVLASGGPGADWTWKLVTDVGAGNLDAIFVRQNGSDVGTGGTNTTLDFYENFSLTQPVVGIASIRLAENINITGINTVSGNLGIGTDAPTVKLDVNGSVAIGGSIYDANGSPGNNGQILSNITGIGLSWANTATPAAAGSDGQVQYNNSGSFNGASALYYDDVNDRVGVGTDSPQATLHVVDEFLVSTAGAASTQRITQRAYTTDNGSLSWEGSAGQLFSITNNLTSGSIFSVNDVSGIPSIDVDADGTIQLAPLNATEYVGIGTTNPTQKLDVNGNVAIGGSVYDNNNLPGTNGQVLSNVTGFGVSWTDAPTGQVNVNEISSGSYYIGAFETTGTTGQAYIETTNPVVLTSTGNIGINSTAPTVKLDVAGKTVVGNPPVDPDIDILEIRSSTQSLKLGGSKPTGTTSNSIISTDAAAQQHNLILRNTNGNGAAYGAITFETGDTTAEERLRISKAGNVGIGTDNPSGAADPNNTTILNAGIVTANFYYGDGSGLINLPAAAAVPSDGQDFNTGITTTKYASASDDIDGFTAIAVTFPSTAGRKYLVESIHVTNITAGDLYITSRIDYDGGEDVPFTNKVLIPEQGAIDIVDESFVCNPSDNIRLAAYNGIGATAGGILNGLDCFVTYTEKTDTNYIGIGSTTKSTFTDETVFTSNTNPSVINTITLSNNSDVADIDASVSMFRGGTIRQGYFVYNLTIPQNSSVQILPKAKRLNPTDTIVVNSTSTDLGINVAGKYIT
jgi:hypothetical protein